LYIFYWFENLGENLGFIPFGKELSLPLQITERIKITEVYPIRTYQPLSESRSRRLPVVLEVVASVGSRKKLETKSFVFKCQKSGEESKVLEQELKNFGTLAKEFKKKATTRLRLVSNSGQNRICTIR